MDFTALADDWQYLLVGTFPEGPPGGALLTLILSAISGVLSAALGLALGIALVMLAQNGWPLKLLRTVTPEQVKSVAQRFFGDDQLTVGTLVPQPLPAGAKRAAPQGDAAGSRLH